MSEIDWSKAPNGATHYGTCWGKTEYFYRIPGLLGGQYDFWNVNSHNPEWGLGRGVPSAECLYDRNNALLGELLPAVGEYVYIANDATLIYGSGEEGEVLCHVENCAVVRMSYGLGCFEARFLRTAGQMQAAEREKAIDLIMYDLSLSPESRYIARRVLDAGYQKK